MIQDPLALRPALKLEKKYDSISLQDKDFIEPSSPKSTFGELTESLPSALKQDGLSSQAELFIYF